MIKYISAFGTKDDRIKTMIERDKDGREMAEKTLLDQWRSIAYNENADRNKLQALWQRYFLQERDIYAELLKNPDEVVSGTVKELAEKFIGMIKREIRDESELEELDEALALQNVSNMPARVKCAVLAWHTLDNALEDEEKK